MVTKKGPNEKVKIDLCKVSPKNCWINYYSVESGGKIKHIIIGQLTLKER